MLDQVLEAFHVKPNHDFNLMTANQTLYETTARVLDALAPVLASEVPDLVLVQGDTTTTFTAALAAFYARIPVGHIEAGLRTRNRWSPYPEEVNRQLTTRLSSLHFAATQKAAENLTREGVPADSVWVTGNTGIDAALQVREGLATGRIPRRDRLLLDSTKKMLLVTAHRRESFGEGLESICSALATLSEREDVEIVFPVHCNPRVREPVYRVLAHRPNIYLVEPLEYTAFIDLLDRCYLVLTDSGGIQEEGPSLGKPVIVLRTNTERTEAVDAGGAVVVGTDRDRIIPETHRLIDDDARYQRMARERSPFGDGKACERIANLLETYGRRPDIRKKRRAASA
jgi:UDP-N-acetylglucosamine 2-epimerase (non-hydrolysing)